MKSAAPSRQPAPLLLLLGLACQAVGEDSRPDKEAPGIAPDDSVAEGESAVPTDSTGDSVGEGALDSGGQSCGGTRPVLAPVVPETVYTLSGGGIDETTGDLEPIVEVLIFSLPVLATDADGDLHSRSLWFWMEPADDGLIDPAHLVLVDSFFAEVRCQTGSSADGLAWVGLSGTFPLPFDTAYDVGIQVVDALGFPSEVWMGTVYSPREDGSPGGPPDGG